MLIVDIARYLFYGAGLVTGYICGRFRTVEKPVEIRPMDGPKPRRFESWETKISPQIRTLKDRITLGHNVLFRRDTTHKSAEDLISNMAQIALEAKAAKEQEIGAAIPALAIKADIVCAGRIFSMGTGFVFATDSAGRNMAVHPASEVRRLKCLDWAMKCYLN
jgi:hypothetical protein